MSEINILVIDLAKGSFQVCVVRADGTVVFNRSVSRPRLVGLRVVASWRWKPVLRRIIGAVSPNRMAMRWLIPAAYVKPFVKRQKIDRADAEAMAEADTLEQSFAHPFSP